MNSIVKSSITSLTVGVLAVGAVFGLAALMVLKGYEAAVIIAVVSGTSVAAARLIHRLQVPPEPPHSNLEGRREHRWEPRRELASFDEGPDRGSLPNRLWREQP
ncbi:hypothetical protein ABZ914_03840 [Spirillospora sp. NPDC046719]